MEALKPGDPERIGRYRLLGRLGEGGMGRVYLGASPAGRAVAVKVVRPELAGDQMFRARFRAEVEAARKVGGAFTSPVVDADPDGTVPWLATAYVSGLSLGDAVRRHGPFPEHLLRTLGAGLGEALGAVHRAGLLHRDLKPGNILLAKDGPRVIDFGISRAVDGTRLTSEGRFVGSPGYMPPEQIRGEDPTPAGDVFAFGAVLAFAATGRPPYGTGAVHTVLHRTLHQAPDLDGVPPALAAMVAACLSPDPGRRPPVELLARLLAARPVEPGWLPGDLDREIGRREDTLVDGLRAVARARTRRRLLLGGAATAGLVAAGGGTALALARSGGDGRPPAGPRLLWKATLPSGGDILVPQVLGGTIVAFGLFAKSSAFDAATGRRLWEGWAYNVGVDRTLIYARTARDDTVVAMDPRSRARAWSVRLPPGFGLQGLRGPDNGLLAALGRDGTLLGMDARTGKRLWTRRTHPEADLQGFRNGTLVVLAGKEGILTGLDQRTGAVRWTREYRTRGVILPQGGDLMFSSSDADTFDALSAATGRTLWTAGLGDDVQHVTVANGTAYLSGTALHALDLTTGRRAWGHEPAVQGVRDRTLLVNDGRAHLLDNRRLITLDARTGRRLWAADVPADDDAPLALVGGLVCTGASAPTTLGLYGWNAATGGLEWSHRLPATDDTDRWTLTAAGPHLVGVQRRTLLAFRLAGG
ncbi:PQQ-binding-like beta-propeller repeat protein [Spirillospora sp. NPDC050679]